jgi:hypothetical protein
MLRDVPQSITVINLGHALAERDCARDNAAHPAKATAD